MKLQFVQLIFLSIAFSQVGNGQPTHSTATAATSDLREDLLQRAIDIQSRAKVVIAKLKLEQREHLAILLAQEEWNVLMVSNELRNSKPDPVRLAVLEAELIKLEYRINKEISILQRDTLTQEVLLDSAQTLVKWIEEQSKNLETQNNEQAHKVYIKLQQELALLNEMVLELTKAKNKRTIERVEVVLRVIENRLYETLKKLNFKPSRLSTLKAISKESHY